MFEREKYYSFTDIQKRYDISRLKLLLFLDDHMPQVIESKVTYGGHYSITAKYYLKEDIDALFLVFKV